MNNKKRQLTVPRAGFSLIELIIALAIMGILVTMGVTFMLAARPHARLEQAEVQVSAYLNQARNLAVSEEIQTRVFFDTTDHTLVSERLDTDTGVWSQAYPVMELPEGVEFDTVTFNNDEAEFTTRGSLLTGGSLVMQNENDETFTLSGNLASGRFVSGAGNLR